MLQTVSCIKFGEILLDENRKLLLLCTHCHTDYDDLQKFRLHLEFCGATDVAEAPMHGIFERNVSLLFPTVTAGNGVVEKQQILGRYVKGNKEFLIYKFNGVKKLETLRTKQQFKNSKHDDELMDLIKIEEELLDPRWYTDSNEQVVESAPHHTSLASYNELVEAVTPFVQFKENFTTNGKQNKLKTSTIAPIPTQKPKNDYILNDKSTTLNAVKPHPVKVQTYQKKSHLSNEKQIPTIATEPAPNVANYGRVIKLPVEMLKVKPPIEPVKLLSNVNGKTKQKLPLQRQQIESCKAAPTNVTLFAKVPIKIKTLPIKTETISTTQSDIVPALNETKHFTKPMPSLSFHPSPIQASPIVAMNDTNHLIPSSAINAPANSMQTEQILNKLQNLGLQVKRKLPNLSHQDQLATSSRNTANDKTLELLRKLQSKGMKVKIIQNTQRPVLPNSVDVEKKPRLENTNGYMEPTYLNPGDKKLTLIWPQ